MSSFASLHLSAVDCHPGIVDWIRSWAEIEDDEQALELLTPKDWFFRGHDQVPDNTSKNCDGIWIGSLKLGLFLITINLFRILFFAGVKSTNCFLLKKGGGTFYTPTPA